MGGATRGGSGGKSPASRGEHRGNKAHLPQKPCAQCGLAMTWRKSWARNWESVRYCSDRCRADARRTGTTAGDAAMPGKA